MTLNSLEDVLREQVEDLLSAENQLVKALPKVAQAAQSPELRKAFEEHLDQTRNHVKRLEKAMKKKLGDPGDPLLGKLRPGMSVEPTIETRPNAVAAQSGAAHRGRPS